MNRGNLIVSVVVLILSGAGKAEAGVVFSDLGPGGSFSSSSSWTIQMGNPTAFEFTAAQTETLSSVEVAVGAFASGVTGVAYLTTDIGGFPGLTLSSWAFAVPVTSQGSIVTLDYPTIEPAVTLTQGTPYWIYLDDRTSANYAWFGNSTGYTGPTAGYYGGQWHAISYGSPAAFQINGSAVPEPSSIAILALGCAILAATQSKSRMSKCLERKGKGMNRTLGRL